MLGTSSSALALAKKMAKPKTKKVTHTATVPKTKIVTQGPQQKITPKDTEWADLTLIRPRPPALNLQEDRENGENQAQKCTLCICLTVGLTLWLSGTTRSITNISQYIQLIMADTKQIFY